MLILGRGLGRVCRYHIQMRWIQEKATLCLESTIIYLLQPYDLYWMSKEMIITTYVTTYY